jgi:hypothetical protein
VRQDSVRGCCSEGPSRRGVLGLAELLVSAKYGSLLLIAVQLNASAFD